MKDNEQIKKVFSKNLKKYMTINNLKQSDISSIVNVSQQSVSYWLNGKLLPRMGTIEKLADYFGILKSELLEDDNSQELYKAKRLQTLYLIANNMDDNDFNELVNYARYLNSKNRK